MRIHVSWLDIDDFHRRDLVRFATINHEADGFVPDEGAVRLTFGIERVAAGGAGGLPALRDAAAF